jgi:hypothetical protein
LLQEISNNGQLLAIIVPHNYSPAYGVHFLTPDDFSQQLAFIHHPAGHMVQPHIHNLMPRKVYYTQETLLIKTGKLRVDFYDEQQNYLESRILEAGDVILLISGGHGFEILEDTELYEVKQGPYTGEVDKTRFNSIDNSNLYLRGTFNE